MSNTARAATPAAPVNEESVSIGVRLPAHLVEALKVKRATMAKAMPGVAITISDALRALLLAGLAAES